MTTAAVRGKCYPGDRRVGPGYSANIGGGYAHRRVLSEKLGRPLQRGELATHACDNRWCVNPRHIFLGSKSSNMKEALERHPTLAASMKKSKKQKEHARTTMLTFHKRMTPEEKENYRAKARGYNRRSWNDRTPEQLEQHREACRVAALKRYRG